MMSCRRQQELDKRGKTTLGRLAAKILWKELDRDKRQYRERNAPVLAATPDMCRTATTDVERPKFGRNPGDQSSEYDAAIRRVASDGSAVVIA
jgi:hypothetical protein